VADITYIRLHGEFVYLAVVLDASPCANTRCCPAGVPSDRSSSLGWSMSRPANPYDNASCTFAPSRSKK
jgi:hypothetical protein